MKRFLMPPGPLLWSLEDMRDLDFGSTSNLSRFDNGLTSAVRRFPSCQTEPLPVSYICSRRPDWLRALFQKGVRVNDEQKFLLDNLLKRIDFYINTINTKAAFIITFDTFVLGTILIKYQDILKQFANLKVQAFVPYLFLVAFVGVVMSLWWAFKAVGAFLASGNQAGAYQSLVYFGSVKEMPLATYTQAVNNLNGASLLDDYVRQTHLLSGALSSKFENLNKSIWWSIFGVLLPIVIAAVAKLADFFLS